MVSFTGTAAIVLVVFSVPIIVIEFLKSGDISVKSFGLDLFAAILETVLATMTLTLIWKSEGLNFVLTDLLIGFVAIADIWVSTLNTYKTGLRNIQADPGALQHQDQMQPPHS